ncbi:hypothetical protein MKX54_10265 [Alkalihalobacillus sp. FSL R5-0424]
MSSILRKKETIKKHVYSNSESGKTTTLHDFLIEHSLEREELYRILDVLVEEEAIQWTSEEQVVSFPLPEWYKKQLQQITSCHLTALRKRQLNKRQTRYE